MNDETEQIVEDIETQEVEAQEAETQEVEQEPVEERKSTYVDFDNWENLTPEQRGALKDRIDDLTTQARFAQRDLDHLKEHLGNRLEKLSERTGKLEEAEFGDQVEQLRAQKVQALEEYDFEKAAAIDEQLMEVKLSQRQMPQPEPTPEPSEAQIDPGLQSYISEWGAERDDSGNYVRPWANPGHPEYEKAVDTAIRYSKDPVWMADVNSSDNPTVAFLNKFDKAYRGRSRPQEVLSGATNASPQNKGKITLNADQRRVADLMGLSHDAYAASLKEIEG